MMSRTFSQRWQGTQLVERALRRGAPWQGNERLGPLVRASLACSWGMPSAHVGVCGLQSQLARTCRRGVPQEVGAAPLLVGLADEAGRLGECGERA